MLYTFARQSMRDGIISWFCSFFVIAETKHEKPFLAFFENEKLLSRFIRSPSRTLSVIPRDV